MRNAGLMKPTDVKSVLSLPKTGSGRAGRKTDKQARTTAHWRMENYQGSTINWSPLISQIPGTNYCGIISCPQRPDELQALWAQRVSDQRATSWSTRLTQPKADGAPRWNATWRRPKGQAAQQSHCFCPVDSAQWHSHKPDILSPDRLVVEGWCGVCEAATSDVSALFLSLQSNIHSIRRTNAHTHAAHTPVPVLLW